MKLGFIAAVAALSLSFQQANAQIVPGRFLGSWQSGRVALDDGTYSCQAVQCSGQCGLGKYFLLIALPGKSYVIPSFNNDFFVPPGTEATLKISGKKYRLRNRAKKPDKVLTPVDGRTLVAIVNAIKALERKSKSARFEVTTPSGTTESFSVRGFRRVLAEFNEQCESAKRGY